MTSTLAQINERTPVYVNVHFYSLNNKLLASSSPRHHSLVCNFFFKFLYLKKKKHKLFSPSIDDMKGKNWAIEIRSIHEGSTNNINCTCIYESLVQKLNFKSVHQIPN